MAHSGLFDGKIVEKSTKNDVEETVEFINNLANKVVKDMDLKIGKMPSKHLAMWELKRNAGWTNNDIAIAFCSTPKAVKAALKKIEKKYPEELLTYTARKKVNK